MVNVRRVTFAVITALVLIPAASPKNTHETLYLGGTLGGVEERTTGTLDVSDPVSLQFKHGSTTLRLPYASIRDIQVSTLKSGKKSRLGHLSQVPFRNHRAEELAITFHDESGHVGNARFRVDESSGALLQAALNQKMQAQKTKVEDAKDTIQRPEAWWGDKYWKTARNRKNWPEPVENTPVLAGTK